MTVIINNGMYARSPLSQKPHSIGPCRIPDRVTMGCVCGRVDMIKFIGILCILQWIIWLI